MPKPWTDGPKELLQHAVDHFRQKGDFDRRIAMISIDNAVELMIKTYLGLPKRTRDAGAKSPSRTQLEEATNSFPKLLDLLEEFASDKLIGISLDDIEWYHRLRNRMYHDGNGITVEHTKVETYLELARILFENLFGDTLDITYKDGFDRLGEFIIKWAAFEKALREKLPPKNGEFAYYWKRDFLSEIDPKARETFDAVSSFRNNVVHGLTTPTAEEIEKHTSMLEELFAVLSRI